MVQALIQAIVAFLLTGVIGARIAQAWQARAAKEARFFEASKDMYGQMMKAVDDISRLVGKRLYATQRICLLSSDSNSYADALEAYRNSIVEWNEQLFSIELAVRTRFRDASLNEFESIQGRLAKATSLVDAFLHSSDQKKRSEIFVEIRQIRADFFSFTQSMIKEARLLHRQMHFGVVVKYDQFEIGKMSTKDLIKALFTSRVEGQSIVRSPSDFGLPVPVNNARFGIYE